MFLDTPALVSYVDNPITWKKDFAWDSTFFPFLVKGMAFNLQFSF